MISEPSLVCTDWLELGVWNGVKGSYQSAFSIRKWDARVVVGHKSGSESRL